MWSCKACGTENDAATGGCAGCGATRSSRLRLTFPATGATATIAVSTSYGQALLRTMGGEDARFAGEPQLRFERTASGWTVAHHPGARNPTWMNGAPLVGVVVVATGSVLTIGPERLPITLDLVHDASMGGGA